MTRLRVAYLIGELLTGGSERQLFLLLRAIDRMVWEPTVVVMNHNPVAPLNRAIRELGVSLEAVPSNCPSVRTRLLFLTRLLRELAPDVVHSWTIHDNPYAGLAGWLAGVPVRWGSLRGSLRLNWFRELPALYRWLSLHSVNRLVVNAPTLVDELRAAGVRSSRTYLLPNCVAVPPVDPNPSSSALGVDLSAPIVGIVGNLRAIKNHTLFIKAMEQVVQHHPTVHGVIIGQAMPDEPDTAVVLSEAIMTAGLSNRVHLTGFRQDVPALLGRMTVYCHTSLNEGTPNAILEAQAAGLPVVATRVGGISAVVQDGVNGFLVEPDDVCGIADNVLRLLGDPSLARSMGAAGQAYVRRNHACTSIAQQLTDAYCEALSGRRRFGVGCGQP